MVCGRLCDVLNIVNLAFIIVTIPFYILILVVILRYREDFKSSFFIFFVSTGVADLWFLIHKTVFRHIPALIAPTWAMEQEWVATVLRMGIWSIYMAEVHGVILLTINRFTALVTPIKHTQLWKDKYVKLALTLQWLLALPWSIPMILPSYHSKFTDESLDYMEMNDKEAMEIWFKTAAIVEPFVFGLSLLVMYVTMFYFANRRNRRIAADPTNRIQHRNKSVKKTEFNFAVLGLVVSIIYALLCVTYVAEALHFHWRFLDMAYNYLTTMFVASNPYLLLLFSTKLREKTKERIKCYLRFAKKICKTTKQKMLCE